MQLVTRIDQPQLWDGPSVLLSASDSAGRCVVAATGYRRHLAEWEDRWPGTFPMELAGLDADVAGDPQLLAVPLVDQPGTTVEIDLVADTPQEWARALPLLRDAVPAVVLDGLQALGPVGSVSASANKDLPRSRAWQEAGVAAVDLVFNTLPSRRGDMSLPLISASRQVRLVGWSTGLLALWQPTSGRWPDEAVRWPHHGVPSPAAGWYERAGTRPLSAEARLTAWLEHALDHEHYFLDTWGLELAASEQEIFTQLAAGQATFAGLQLSRLQADLGVLASHLDGVRRAQRTLQRRSEESAVFHRHPGLTATARRSAAHLDASLLTARQNLRESFSLLASAAQGAQAYASGESQKQSERLNVLVTVVTALLLVPSLVAGIYGANLRELSPDSTGSAGELAVLMAVPALLTAGALQLLRAAGRRTARSWAVVLMALGVAVGCGYAAAQVWSSRSGALVAAALAVAGLATGSVLRRHRPTDAGVGTAGA